MFSYQVVQKLEPGDAETVGKSDDDSDVDQDSDQEKTSPETAAMSPVSTLIYEIYGNIGIVWTHCETQHRAITLLLRNISLVLFMHMM